MRVPTRKPGKYTGKKPDPHITKAKYNELKLKLAKLINVVRPRLIKEVQHLASMGDFSDNAAYSIAKGKLRGINQRILDIEDHLKKAIIIKLPKNNNTVQLGSRVTIECGEKQKTYQILGSSETDPKTGVISHNSPIGSALLGGKIGDTVKIPKNKKEYKIIKIE